MVMAFSGGAHALDWRFEPMLTASATFTDNANQSDEDPENALILRATPGFTLRSEGSRRVQASLQYGLTGVARFGEDDGDDSLFHNLGAIGNAEMIEDFLFIDGTARISQELISLFGSPADATINDENRTTVGTYSISPYIQKRLGTFANAQARYTNSGAIFENDVASNSSVNTFSAALNSGTRFVDLGWGLDYSIRKANNRDDSDTTFERASATARYALTRKFAVFGTVGEEWNDYTADGASSDIDGSFYSVGFGWAPSRRTNIEASVGERYFGSTYSLSGSYRSRMSRWTVSYSEDVSDVTQQLLEQTSRIWWKCGGFLVETRDDVNPIPGVCDGPLSVAQLTAALSGLDISADDLATRTTVSIAKGVYIIKSLNAGVFWDLGRLGFGLSAQDTRRLYEAFDEAEDRVQVVTGVVSYRLSPRDTANAGLSFTRNTADGVLLGGTERDDDIVSLSLGLNHRFTEDFSGALFYRYTQRDSNLASSDYAENRITASVNMNF